MSYERGSPQLENEIDVPGRHLVTMVEKVSHFKFDLVIIWSPVMWSTVRLTSRWWIGVWWYVIPIFVTDCP